MQSGTFLGPYEVTAPLGAGGMGEVYRARDSRLDRTVAIKILPKRFSSDEKLRERFEREARAISSLSHPNICTLYDIGHHDGVDYLVMEYLEGESLAERLQRGALPIEQVIRYGVEIAEALEKAHRAGIVHRDLKPGNIILTKSGAKLLDFGLAKFAAAAQTSEPNDATATMRTEHKPLTEEGVIVGTFQYMAPEQIDGREADARTDIFALGAVLYEMATGKRAFDAKSRASLIASILDRDPPPINSVQPLTPRAFERVVQLCLAKEPDERWQSAHDVAAELRWIRDTSSETIGPAAKRSRWKRLAQMASLAAAGLIAGAAATWLLTRDRTAPRPVSRFAISIPGNAPNLLGLGPMAISRDGTRIAYVGKRGNAGGQLYVRTAGNPAPRLLTGAEDSFCPAFSPDGQWVAYLNERGLFKAPVDGGAPVRLHPHASGGLGVHWSGDTIFFTRHFTSGVWTIHQDGGEAKNIIKVDPAKGARAIGWPHALPGNETLLVTVWNNGPWEDAKIVAHSLRDGTSRVVVDGGYAPTYLPSGHLIFARAGNVMAVPFDAKAIRTTGNAVTVVSGVAWDPENGSPQFAVAQNGDLIYAAGGSLEKKNTIVVVDRNGRATTLVPTPRPYGDPSISGDGRLMAVTLETSTFDVWLLDVERDVLTRISFGGDDLDGNITDDGSYVYWLSSRTGKYNIYRSRTDGGGTEEPLLPSPNNQWIGSVARDHSFVLLTAFDKSGKGDLVVLPLDTRKPRTIAVTPHNERANGVSPDGKWLAYISDESGRDEVYVRAVDGSPARWQISVGGGNGGGFTSDGKAVLYRAGTKFYEVPIETTPRFRAGKPKLVVDEPTYTSSWSITKDGRFLVVKAQPPASTNELQIVLNWGEELKRRVPM